MSKRKRHDSLSSTTSQAREDSPNEREKVNTEKEQCLESEEFIKKVKQQECQQQEKDKNSVAPLAENVNLVNAQQKETITTVDNNTVHKNIDNFGIRRKSNRILSLKRSSNVSSSLASIEESPAQTSTSKPLTTESTQSSQATSTSSDVTSTSSNVPSSSTTQTAGNNQQSKVRKMQVWTADDTRWFFEALCEHGKDFPHIVSYIAARCEKKGIPSESIKNYEQVRHYYYRMWHKISQMLKISNEVEKGVQELYGLINYGELWKKFGSKFDLRLNASLQQLVDVGYTVFKMKGKSVRVRTPVCNALKRVHNIDSKASSKPVMQPIPKEIDVELLPQTNADWMRVHSLAQNPRLRTKLSMQHRLTTLISYLERRWSLSRVAKNASNLQSLTADESVIEGASEECSSVDKGLTTKTFGIRLRPKASEKLIERLQLKSTNNSISVSNFRSTTNTNAQTDLSLSAYLKNLYAENANSDGKGKQFKMRKYSRKAIAQAAQETAGVDGDAKAKDDDENKTEQSQKDNEEPQNNNQVLDLFKMLDSMNAELAMPLNSKASGNHSNNGSPEKVGSASTLSSEQKQMNDSPQDNFLQLFHPPDHTTLGQWLSGESGEKAEDADEEGVGQTADQHLNTSPLETKSGKSRRRGSLDSTEFTVLTAKEARQGWTLKDAESISIGELYLLFSRPPKLVLEYSWEELKEVETEEHSKELLEKENTEDDIKEPVSDMLQKLLIAANITLANLKKPISTLTNNQASANTVVTPFSEQTTSGNKGSRKRSTKMQSPPNTQQPSSQPSLLLSNLIQETILRDCSKDASGSLTPTNLAIQCPTNVIANQQQQLIVIPSNSSVPEQLQLSNPVVGEHFVAPMRPAPRTSHSNQQTKSAGGRNRNNMTILDDPSKVEVALSSLKDNKFRQRRFMYNLQNKVLGPNSNSPNKQPAMNGMGVNATTTAKQSTLLVTISNQHLTSAESQPQKQILLTDLLSNQIPHETTMVVPFLAATTSSSTGSLANQQQQQSTVEMSTPLLESTPKVPSIVISPPGETYHQLQQMTSFSALKSFPISPSTEDTELIQTPSNSTVEDNQEASTLSNSNLVQFVNNNSPTTSDDNQSLLCSKPPSGTEELSNHSQFSWFNEHNNDSMSSLLAACDIVANEELQKAAANNENSLSINSEFETHVNSMALSDNSVDLIAKFADLAAQITADSRHSL